MTRRSRLTFHIVFHGVGSYSREVYANLIVIAKFVQVAVHILGGLFS